MNKERKQLEVDDQSGGDRTLVANAKEGTEESWQNKTGMSIFGTIIGP